MLRSFSRPRGLGSMRESLEMYTASLMQKMVQIRKKNRLVSLPTSFVSLFKFLTFRALGVESPRAGAISTFVPKHKHNYNDGLLLFENRRVRRIFCLYY